MIPTDATSGPRAGQPAWHALEARAALDRWQVRPADGLTAREATARLERHGPNALPEAPPRSLAAVFLDQFKSPLIYLLLLAAGIATALGEISDALVILVVVLVNGLVGAIQEGRAERSLAALRTLAAQRARVVRDGREGLVLARDLVPGDVLLIAAGDAVTADARLVEAAALQTAEAAMTGESLPVAKTAEPVPPETALADRRSMVYAGTHVTAGRAVAVVVATGLETELGRIAKLAESAEPGQTPLERRIAQFGRYVIVAAVTMFVVINVIGFLRGLPAGQIAMVGIGQLVGMIPEGLPVAMTVALAVGVQRMARRRAIVRRLSAVETLGSTTVICSDKTGTLTRNEMTVTSVWLAGGRVLAVSGVGYTPEGGFSEAGRVVDASTHPDLRALLEAVALCNDARLSPPSDSEPRWLPVGDPTEVALVTLARKGGVVLDELALRQPRRAEIPFDSATKLMATEHDVDGRARVLVKGAPEVVLELCTRARVAGSEAPLDREAVRRAADEMAGQALRVLAVARVDGLEAEGTPLLIDGLRGRLTLLGLVGQMDPPRAEAGDAVASCRAAGVRAVMVTGDHKSTGYAVAKALGIARPGDAAVDGHELEAMTDEELARDLDRISVFARVHPAQKLRIVEAFQRRGHVVAMTGDGVNDAPALVAADVGVAMGITGTDVAKEAAKIVVTDDNFASIVAAVEEGRIVYRNLKKVVLYLFSTSLAAVLVLLAALALGYPPPLSAVQILWINLVTEGSVTVNLIVDPPEGDEMKRPPVPRDEPIVTREMLQRVAVMTPALALSTLGWFVYRYESGVPFAQAQTETFTVLAVCQWFNVLNCRSAFRSAFSLGVLSNPWLLGGIVAGNLLQAAVVFVPFMNRVFHTVPISLADVVTIGAVASFVLWAEELRKLVVRRRAQGAAA